MNVTDRESALSAIRAARNLLDVAAEHLQECRVPTARFHADKACTAATAVCNWLDRESPADEAVDGAVDRMLPKLLDDEQDAMDAAEVSREQDAQVRRTHAATVRRLRETGGVA